MDVKLAVFAELDRVMKPGAILATNTSTLDVNAIARHASGRPTCSALHFFSPANVMRLLEIVRGAATAKDVLATALALGEDAAQGGGGVGRLRRLHRQPHARALHAGRPTICSRRARARAQVDAAMEAFGFAMGPFKRGRSRGQRHRLEHPQAPPRREAGLQIFARCPTSSASSAASDRRRARAGTNTADGRKPLPSKSVDELIAAHRAELGITPRRIDDAEIVDRLVYALVNEGARILDEGIAARASDIDVVYLTGYGFPAMRGGPMFHADAVGLPLVRAAHARVRAQPARRSGILEARGVDRAAGGERRFVGQRRAGAAAAVAKKGVAA